ncbi:hypothetical protein CY35_05G045600 [Sphagnum magellanicum]|nr:hypothetical protein CY35_05G045600 [Sphagnum magellanicum]
MAPCLPLGGVHVRTGQQLHIAEIVDGCAALLHLRERLLHCLLVAVAHPRLLCLACNLQRSLLRLCSSCWPWHRCLCSRIQQTKCTTEIVSRRASFSPFRRSRKPPR